MATVVIMGENVGVSQPVAFNLYAIDGVRILIRSDLGPHIILS